MKIFRHFYIFYFIGSPRVTAKKLICFEERKNGKYNQDKNKDNIS